MLTGPESAAEQWWWLWARTNKINCPTHVSRRTEEPLGSRGLPTVGVEQWDTSMWGNVFLQKQSQTHCNNKKRDPPAMHPALLWFTTCILLLTLHDFILENISTAGHITEQIMEAPQKRFKLFLSSRSGLPKTLCWQSCEPRCVIVGISSLCLYIFVLQRFVDFVSW